MAGQSALSKTSSLKRRSQASEARRQQQRRKLLGRNAQQLQALQLAQLGDRRRVSPAQTSAATEMSGCSAKHTPELLLYNLSIRLQSIYLYDLGSEMEVSHTETSVWVEPDTSVCLRCKVGA